MPDQELVRHVAGSTGLSPADARRVIDDILSWHAEPVEDYVRRRHSALHRHGMKNPQIFALLAEELRTRPFAAPEMSERQLRRTIYG